MTKRTTDGSGRRTRVFPVRLSDSEAEQVERLVERTGLSAAALVRRALLDAEPSGRRRPSAEDRAVVRLMGALGKIGANIHQLAGHADAGCFDEETSDAIDYAERDLAELRSACAHALGYEPSDSGENDEDDADIDD